MSKGINMLRVADPLVDSVKEKFNSSLVKRAESRHVEQIGPNRYVVYGNSKLGDYYDEYYVSLIDGKYHCSCQEHSYGEYRRFCSHCLGVILYKRQHINDYIEEPLKSQIPNPQDDMFGFPKLPSKFTAFRPHQWKAIEDVVKAFEDGYKYVLLDANPGSGKTLIAETVRRLLKTKMVYTCSTIMLQEQFMQDFGEYARLIKGRSNYPTLSYPNRFRDGVTNLSAADCTDGGKGECPFCHIDGDTSKGNRKCPYRIAKLEASKSDVLVTNSAYFLYEANFGGENSVCSGAPFVVIDECDLLENTLMGFVSFSLSQKKIQQYDLKLPAKKTVDSAWVEWIEHEALPKLGKIFLDVNKSLGSVQRGSTAFVKLLRESNYLRKTIGKLKEIEPEIQKGSWVYTGYTEGHVEFKPVTVYQYAQDAIWQHGQKFLCMSGTVVSGDQYAVDLGIPDGEYKYLEVDYSFAKEHRPVFVVPVANMTYKTEEAETPKLIDGIIKVLDKYRDKRVLIHSVSKKLTFKIKDGIDKANLQRPVLTYTDQESKARVLTELKNQKNSVTIAYSFDRGVDLYDDLCECIVIAKLPMASLSDKQVNARLHSKGGETWYTVNTIRTLLQQSGRGVRHEHDHCDIWILDAQFVYNLLRKKRHLIPNWFKEALRLDQTL